ncbi:MAG: hypothetical protein ACR2NZ_20645 [Rubripirellula sp.]
MMNRTLKLGLLSLALITVLDHPFLNAAEQPEDILGFLEPGIGVSIRTYEGSADVAIRLYSKEQFKIAQDARTLDLETLQEKYDDLKSRVAEIRARAAKEDAGQGQATVSMLRDTRSPLGIIDTVGSDYVVIRMIGSYTGKQVIAKRRIAKLYLDADGVRLMVRGDRGNYFTN